MEHEHSECHHSSLFVIGGIQGVTPVPCYNCTWSPLLTVQCHQLKTKRYGTQTVMLKMYLVTMCVRMGGRREWADCGKSHFVL